MKIEESKLKFFKCNLKNINALLQHILVSVSPKNYKNNAHLLNLMCFISQKHKNIKIKKKPNIYKNA